MSKLKVVNIKCGGCENSIRRSLTKAGLKNVMVDVDSQTVSFDGDEKTASQKLLSMGYPPAGSKAAKSLVKKGKSLASCLVGRLGKNNKL